MDNLVPAVRSNKMDRGTYANRHNRGDQELSLSWDRSNHPVLPQHHAPFRIVDLNLESMVRAVKLAYIKPIQANCFGLPKT
jgi:hypothetical protein